MALTTYVVNKMRAYKPTGKVAQDNPDRLYTVSGVFFATEVAEDGSLTVGEALTFPSKNITREDALTEGFVLDIANGILTLPTGERGRKAMASLSAEDIDAELNALRNPTPVAPEVPAEKPAKGSSKPE